ncbi:ankyrin, partial [Lentithecium fluviatile CBS 122367]
LLDAGADVNAIEGEYGTSLQAAAGQGNIRICQSLLRHGALVNSPICGIYGTPLQAAAAHGDEEVVQFLLDHGASINARGGKLGTALQASASRLGRPTFLAQSLLERGA